MITRIILILIIAFTSTVFAIVKSSYYEKASNWQESVANSIQKFHGEWGRLKALLSDESILLARFPERELNFIKNNLALRKIQAWMKYTKEA